MKKLYYLLIMFFMATTAMGQSNNTHYASGYIYLKDGKIIKGRYLYSPAFDKVRIISGKTSMILDSSEIEKIVKSNPNKHPDDEFILKDSIAPPRFFSITEFGVLAGNDDNERPTPFSAGTSLNYFFHRKISAGVGVGLDFLKETYLPVTMNVLYRFRQSKTSPFVMLQAGYQIPLEKSKMAYYDVVMPDYSYSSLYPSYNLIEMDAKGGFLVNPSAGIMIRNKSGLGLSFSVGYRFHRLRYTSDLDSGYKIDVDYNRLSLKLGIIFN